MAESLDRRNISNKQIAIDANSQTDRYRHRQTGTDGQTDSHRQTDKQTNSSKMKVGSDGVYQERVERSHYRREKV